MLPDDWFDLSDLPYREREPLEPDAQLFEDGRKAFEDGDFAEALRLFLASLDLHAHYKTFLLAAECFLALGRPREAVLHAAAAAGLNSGAPPRYVLGRALVAVGDPEQAKSVLRAGLANNRTHGPCRRLLEELVGEHPSDLDESRESDGPG